MLLFDWKDTCFLFLIEQVLYSCFAWLIALRLFSFICQPSVWTASKQLFASDLSKADLGLFVKPQPRCVLFSQERLCRDPSFGRLNREAPNKNFKGTFRLVKESLFNRNDVYVNAWLGPNLRLRQSEAPTPRFALSMRPLMPRSSASHSERTQSVKKKVWVRLRTHPPNGRFPFALSHTPCAFPLR